MSLCSVNAKAIDKTFIAEAKIFVINTLPKVNLKSLGLLYYSFHNKFVIESLNNCGALAGIEY